MILGIDAANIRAGGGVTHLVELLSAADPSAHGFSSVMVWSGKQTLNRLEQRPWLLKKHEPLLDRSLPFRLYWQQQRLSRLAGEAGCNLIFAPGGLYIGTFRPFVTMSQNLLPFEWAELKRYGPSWTLLRCLFLRYAQSLSFRHADGLIFLTQHAKDAVIGVVKKTMGKITVIPHGINSRFLRAPREQQPVNWYSLDRPFRILYVSIIDVYKHQWHVAEAVAMLKKAGLPVVLDLGGPAYPPALKRLQQSLRRLDPAGEYIRYVGAIPHAELHTEYAQADLCLFASSCENMPNILLEGMASGLPVACSNRGPMPEVLGDAGVYFDPENSADIARALQPVIESATLRERLAHAAFARSQSYSWRRCADQTFAFLAEIAHSVQAGSRHHGEC